MKICPTCGYDSPDDSEFCMRCGAYFPDSRGQPSEPAAVPQVEQKPTEDAERAMEQGFQEMTGDDFAGAVARWSEAIKAGMEVDDATYERMLSECVGAIMRSVSKQGVQSRTGVNIAPETIAELVKNVDNIVGVKEASGNITQMDDIIKNKPDTFDVISGDDGITFPLITLGAVGVISVIGNAFPREFSRMVRLALQGDYANALAIHHKFAELFKLLFVDGNPAGVKAMLNAMGMVENKLRLPLVPTRITTFEAMRKILNELNIRR